MRKILSIILAAAMLFAMIPAVAAADTATEGDDALATVTYGFYPGGRSDVNDTWLERITYTKADSFEGITDFAVVRNANLMSFPTSSDNPNDQWAFVGSGIGRTETYAKSADGYGVTISLKTDNTGKGYIGTYMVGAGSWIAFKIKVPETALYEISGITAYAYGNSSADIGMYIAPVTEELAATVAAAADSGICSAEQSGTKYLVYRKDFTPFENLGISDECLMGRVNIRDTSGDYFSAEKEATNKKAQLLEADKEYYLFFKLIPGL